MAPNADLIEWIAHDATTIQIKEDNLLAVLPYVLTP